MRKLTARLLSALLIAQTLSPAFAVERAVRVETPAPAAGLAAPKLSLPNTAIAPPRASSPVSVKAASTQASAAEAKTALPGLEATVRSEQVLSAPQTADGDLKTGAARDFDKTSALSGSDVDASIPFSASVMRLERRSAVMAPATVSIPAPRSATLGERAKSWMPGAAVAAGVGAMAWLAHHLGSPETAAGLPVLAAGMGVVMPAGGSPEAKLLGAVQQHFHPSDSIPTDKIIDAGVIAGLSREQTLAAFGRLAADGHFAVSSRDYAVLLDPSNEPQNPILQVEWRRAMTAAKKIQSGGPLFRVETLSGLKEAFERFAQSPESGHIQHHQIRALYSLTFNETVRDVLKHFEAEAARQPQGEVAKLYKAIGAESRTLEELINSPDSHDALVALLPNYAPAGLAGNARAEKGLAVLKAWIANAGPSDTAKLARKIELYLKDSNKGYGAKIGKNERAEIGAGVGADNDALDSALVHLADQGWLVRAPGGENYVTTFARARFDVDADRAGMKDTHGVFVRGVQLTNQGDLVRVAAGALTIKHALDTFKDQFGEKPSGYEKDLLADATIAYKNSLLSLAHALVRAMSSHYGDESSIAASHRAIQWLESNQFTRTQDPLAAQPAAAKVLAHLIDRIPSDVAVEFPQPVMHAVEKLEELVGKKSSSRDGRLAAQANAALNAGGKKEPLRLPAPNGQAQSPAKASFPVIPEKDAPNLYKYGSNVTAQAASLPKVIGRDDAIDQAIEILLGKETNAPMVVGEAGVGKTALVEGLAQRFVSGDVPEALKGKNIFKLDLQKLVAGTRYRGDAEERFEAVLKEAREKGIILFIDEIHNMLGLGSTGGNTLSLSEAVLEDLGRGRLKMIGATTLADYRKIRKNQALDRRFGPVMLQPATVEDTIAMMKGRRDEYEKHHGVKITDEALASAAQMAKEYVTDKYLPASAFSLLDRTGGSMQMANFKAAKEGKALRATMEPSDVEARIAKDTKIPVEKLGADQRQLLAGLEDRLKKRVIGQDEAVKALARSVKIARMGNKDPNAPPDGFIFLGPTGVGKTELAKALAAEEYNDETAFTRVDMSEFMEKHTVSKLIGTVPGYVGYDQAGMLTEPVRNRPRQVVLLDEIDKAHPDVLKILLQILDNGEITDGQGNRINFRNTKIIMTANFNGAHSVDEKPGIGFNSQKRGQEEIEGSYQASATQALPPELIGRVGKRNIITFKEHSADTLRVIAALKTSKLNKLLERKKMSVTLSDRALDHLVAESAKPENVRYGARPLVKAIEDDMNEALTDAEIEGLVGAGDAVEADFVGGKWVIGKKAAK